MSAPKEQMFLEQIKEVQRHLFGQGIEQDLKKSIELFFEAVRKNSTLAQQELLYSYNKADDVRDFVKRYKTEKCLIFNDKEQKRRDEIRKLKNPLDKLELHAGALDIYLHLAENPLRGYNENHEYNFKLYLDLAEKEDYIPALFILARFCKHNPNNVKFIQQTIEAYYKLVVDGDPVDQYALGQHLFHSGPIFTFALILLHQSAANGFAPAQRFLGRMYITSPFFRVDPFKRVEGRQLLQTCGDKLEKDEAAIDQKIIAEAEITEIDFKKAQEFYQLAHKQDLATAQYQMGCAYEEQIKNGNKNIFHNITEALKWYNLAICCNNLQDKSKTPVLLYRIRENISYFDIVKKIYSLADILFSKDNIELFLQEPGSAKDIIQTARLFLEQNIDSHTKRNIRFKLREIHFRLGQMSAKNNELMNAFRHFADSNIVITVDPIAIATEIVKIQAEVDNFFGAEFNRLRQEFNELQNNRDEQMPTMPKTVSHLIAEYAMPSLDPSREDWALKQAMVILERNKQQEDEAERREEQRRALEWQLHTNPISRNDRLFENSPAFRRFG